MSDISKFPGYSRAEQVIRYHGATKGAPDEGTVQGIHTGGEVEPISQRRLQGSNEHTRLLETAPHTSWDPHHKRDQWSHPLELVLTLISYAVGLGNVWRFPYLCFKNGGGAFLIPYAIMLVFVGLPIFFMETALGQYASLGPLTVWKLSPLFKGVGYCAIFSCFLVSLYYNVVIAYSFYFLFASFTSELPWTHCNHHWNTEHCLDPDDHSGTNRTTGSTRSGEAGVLSRENLTTPSEEYFYNEVLKLTGSIDDVGSVNWQLTLCNLAAWVVVLLALIRGVKSLGKVSYFTAIFPYLMLTILLVRSLLLEGAGEGITFYLTPDFSRLASAKVWVEAATQIFFSLSTCNGGLIALASYSSFRSNCYRDSIIVPIINCLTSFYGGFLCFSVLGFMAREKSVDIAEVATDGPGLVFVVYPEALSRMPVAPLWSVLFFIMMLSLGFGSQFSLTENVIRALLDEFAHVVRGRTMLVRVGYVTIMFLLTLPMCTDGGLYLLTLVDTSISGYPMIFAGLFELFVIMYVYGFDRFADNIKEMLGFRPGLYWKLCWKYIAPLILLALVVFNGIEPIVITLDDYVFPTYAQNIGWCIQAFPVVWIPIWFIGKHFHLAGTKVFMSGISPEPDWGPALGGDTGTSGSSSQPSAATNSLSNNSHSHSLSVGSNSYNSGKFAGAKLGIYNNGADDDLNESKS